MSAIRTKTAPGSTQGPDARRAMGRRSKRKGARLELKTAAWLERAGCAVTKAGGSLGVWDLVAVHAAGIRLVQVKANGWCGPDERARMEATPAPSNATREQWRWDDHARRPRIREWVGGEWIEARETESGEFAKIVITDGTTW